MSWHMSRTMESSWDSRKAIFWCDRAVPEQSLQSENVPRPHRTWPRAIFQRSRRPSVHLCRTNDHLNHPSGSQQCGMTHLAVGSRSITTRLQYHWDVYLPRWDLQYLSLSSSFRRRNFHLQGNCEEPMVRGCQVLA